MIVEDLPTAEDAVDRIGRLLSDTSIRLRRTHALCNRVSNRLACLLEGGDGDAEGGWRCLH